jgi:hypothetical protein
MYSAGAYFCASRQAIGQWDYILMVICGKNNQEV